MISARFGDGISRGILVDMLSRYEHQGLTWIDLESPTAREVRDVASEFGIDHMVAEELLMPSARPLVEFHERYVYLILHFPALRHSHTSREQEVDFVIATTNPGPAFPAEATTSSSEESFLDWAMQSDIARYAFRGVLFGVRLASTVLPKLPSQLLDLTSQRFPDLVNMGALTIVSNIYGNPAVSIPAGTVDGLPVGMQVLARHHADALLFDVALAVERERPWPMVASPVGIRSDTMEA